ncbi:hypothetical protein V8G54_036402 [Vigna mungo]|uniref:Uncharacterized protein n=1 Tax=Vigna mungo TaxID=3915 RepID=A0AAQ3RCP6_VIGMU
MQRLSSLDPLLITSSPRTSPSPTSSSSLAAPASLPSLPPKPSSSPTTPPPTSLLTTPPSPTSTSSPPPSSSSTTSNPSLTTLSSAPASRSRPLPPSSTPSTLYGTKVCPPPTSASTTLFCSPYSPSFFHCYYVKVFQSLSKEKGKNVSLGCNLLLFDNSGDNLQQRYGDGDRK